MMLPAQTDHRAGQQQQGEMNVCSAFVAQLEPFEPVEPTQGGLKRCRPRVLLDSTPRRAMRGLIPRFQ